MESRLHSYFTHLSNRIYPITPGDQNKEHFYFFRFYKNQNHII